MLANGPRPTREADGVMVPGGSPAPLLVTDPGANRVPDTQQMVNGCRGLNGPTSDTSIQMH